ncbi:MAG: DUF4350 domain-containing protein [Desulfomonile tiedjei]|nr:DUF4350 domain-containing protein [Desulfomonile tiedjei]
MSFTQKLLLILCVIVVVAGSTMLRRPEKDSWSRSMGSTYSAGSRGCKALYLLLQELNLPAEKFRWPLSRLDRHRGVLVVAGPCLVPFTDREVSSLKKWVKEGNRLIIFDGTSRMPVPPLPGESVTTESEKEKHRRIQEWIGSGVLHSPMKKFGLTIKPQSDPSRSLMEVRLHGMDASAKISISNESRWEKSPKGWSELISDANGPVLLMQEMGEGKVLAVADPTLPSNGHLADEQNVRLILALLLAEPKPQKILFDEYHHGHAVGESLWSFVGSSIFAWVLLQVAIGLGLFVFSRRAQQSGRFRSLAAPKGRSSLEYVDSMTGIYKACKAKSVALEAILRRALGRISRRVGVPVQELDRSFPDRIARWAGDENKELIALVGECHRAVNAGSDADDAVALARRLTRAARRLDRPRQRS